MGARRWAKGLWVLASSGCISDWFTGLCFALPCGNAGRGLGMRRGSLINASGRSPELLTRYCVPLRGGSAVTCERGFSKPVGERSTLTSIVPCCCSEREAKNNKESPQLQL